MHRLHRPCPRLTLLPFLGAKIARRSRDPHVRHHPLDKTELGSEARQLGQIARQRTLLLRADEALATLREMQRACRAEQTLSPELDLIGGELGM